MSSHLGSHRYTGPRHARPSGPRHAKPAPPTTAHRAAAATGLAAAIALGDTLVMAGTAGAVTPDTWAQLRMCESSGNYHVNTGNGYYGAYQFNLATWHGLGYPGLPSDASPAVQDAAAQKLYNQRGWQPWPACSAKLGLVDDRTASRGDARPPLPPQQPTAKPVVAVTPTSTAPTSTAPSAAGGWDGHYLTVRDVGSVRGDVKAWQAQMVADGYPLAVDGRYGPKSAAAATQFEIDHHLAVDRPGIVGPQVWGTTFAR